MKASNLRYLDSIIVELSENYMACQLTIVDFEEYFSKLKCYELLQRNWETNPNTSLLLIRDDIHRVRINVAGL